MSENSRRVARMSKAVYVRAGAPISPSAIQNIVSPQSSWVVMTSPDREPRPEMFILLF